MDRQEKALVDFLENKEKIDVNGNALLVFHGDKEIFRHYSGEANKDTLFRIYSMTKVVTVISALQLFEQGKFEMDEPLYNYIPEYKDIYVWDEVSGEAKPAKNVIRIRDLFCMSSGLPYEGEYNETSRQLMNIRKDLENKFPKESYTTLQYVKAMSKAALRFEPGTHWEYGLSHDVLGGLIEVISGKTLGEYMKENIFDPLGMTNTFFRCPEDKIQNIAKHHVNPGEDDKFALTARYESGGGGLLASLDDYMTFARTLTRGGTSDTGVRIIGKKMIDLLRMDQLNEVQKKDFNWDYLLGYSYGLGVRTNINPAISAIPGSVGEFGWCGVLGTWVMMDPEENLTAVYMHQRYPNLEAYVQRHLRPLVYGLI